MLALAGLKMSVLAVVWACNPPGPWQLSQPVLCSTMLTFCAAGFFESYAVSRYPVAWHVAQMVSQSFFCP